MKHGHILENSEINRLSPYKRKFISVTVKVERVIPPRNGSVTQGIHTLSGQLRAAQDRLVREFAWILID